MAYEIPTEEIEKIRKSEYGVIVIDEIGEVIFFLEEENTILNYNLLLEWIEFENFLYLGDLNARNKTEIKSLTLIINIFESVAKLKNKNKIRAIPSNEKISEELIRRSGFKLIEAREFAKSVYLEGMKVYEKEI